MKHLKIFENKNSVQSVRNMVKEYRIFLDKIRPVIIEKYYELANSPDYEPDYGEQPSKFEDESELALSNIGYYNGGLQFQINSYDDNGNVRVSYYLDITDDELEILLLKIDANKYNL
jgi:hypothetical protein